VKHKIEGHQELFKDENSGVIVNRSLVDRERYRLAKKTAQDNLESKQEISKLKNDVSEIKYLLQQLLRK
jgi:hypothetical protein